MTSLTVGSKAPNFKIETNIGHFSLSDFSNKKLVLYFYPKDNTPGCTLEAKDFRDHYDSFAKHNTYILGISKDSIESHNSFIESCGLPFPLGSDENLEMAHAYGVWGERTFMGKKYMGMERATFLINEEGMIAQMWRNVSVKDHVTNILKEIEAK